MNELPIRKGTAVQISAAPGDVKHLESLLPNHIRVWGDNVDRIVVTIDTHRSKSGRFRGTNYEENKEKLRRLLSDVAARNPKLQFTDVDYTEATQRKVAQYFFNLPSIPPKAYHGGYFYSLFYGLYVTDAQYVVHFDSDMLFGGGSKTWMREAIACMEARPDVLMTSPYPGPPLTDGKIFLHQPVKDFSHESAPEQRVSREDMPDLAYRFAFVSSRIFMIDLNRFKSKMGALPFPATSAKQRLKANLFGNPPQAVDVEYLLSKALQISNMFRVDMLGSSPGMWSLHPPYRSEEFYRRLPEFINAVEAGNIPDGQRGHYDMNDSFIDWTEARKAFVWHRRYMRMVRDIRDRFANAS